ncbi:hypothetical protein BD413DRAFT_613401 [Trametes elegans]|nr:hypothetical protein BD413DRAFT_613401 [Trametes elegans]
MPRNTVFLIPFPRGHPSADNLVSFPPALPAQPEPASSPPSRIDALLDAARKLLPSEDILVLIPITVVVTGTLNALSILLSRLIFLSDVEPYAALHARTIFALAYFGALVECVPGVILLGHCYHDRIGGACKDAQKQYAFRVEGMGVLSIFPLAVAVAALPARALLSGLTVVRAVDAPFGDFVRVRTRWGMASLGGVVY